METNRNEELYLCNLAFQEYVIRENILGLITKKSSLDNENQKNAIELEINNLRSKANYLFELRKENSVKTCSTK